MNHKMWITLALTFVLVMASIFVPVSGTTGATYAQANAAPLVFLKDGDIWKYAPSTGIVTQLTTWGYNQRPVLSPDGMQIAYNSWATLTVEGLAAGQDVFGTVPSNIWVMHVDSGSAFCAADQPAGAAFFGADPGLYVLRGTPSWSPDGSKIVWAEMVAPEFKMQVVTYDILTGETRVVVPEAPVPYADAGFVAIYDVLWGQSGLMFVNSAANETNGEFEETLYVYDINGMLLSKTLVSSSAAEFLFSHMLVTYNGQEYAGLLYPSGRQFLLELASGTLQEMPALPELYSVTAPTNTATAYMAPNTDSSGNLSEVWTAVYPDRQTFESLGVRGGLSHVAVAPDGLSVAYVGDAITIWQNGQLTTVPGTVGLGTGALTAPSAVSVAWGVNAWRVRDDELASGMGGGGALYCLPAPRLTVNSTAQVTPGLPNAIRSQPWRGSDSVILGQIPGGGVFSVLEGPTCGWDGRNWWRVNYNGVVGWTPEGEGNIYWLQPVSSGQTVCSPAPRLVVGTAAYVLPGPANLIRSQPTRSSAVVGRMPGGSFFHVIGGPQCGPEGRYWWQVQYGSITGWTAQGEGVSYWVTQFSCPNSPLPRLTTGQQARITPGLPNALRNAPGTGSGSVVIGEIPAGDVFTVIGGPQCGAQGRLWWRVNYNGQIGWTAEGEANTYWIEPVSGSTQPPTSVTCSPSPRLAAGMTARVLSGPANVLRSAPGTGSDSVVIGEIPGNGVFGVITGPICAADGRYWWQAQYGSLVGWTAEGQGTSYWVEPYSGNAPPATTCGPTPRLTIGGRGRVTPGNPNTLRTQPGTEGNSLLVGEIPGGGEFSVLAGPVCSTGGRYYWEVQYGNLVGWTAEGQGSTYWLEPYTASQPVTCSPAPRLVAGMTARVTPGAANTLRSAPGTGSDSVAIGEIPGNGVFGVITGPVCAGDGRYWWQVQYGSLVGWTAEGQGSTYWLEPYSGNQPPAAACYPTPRLTVGGQGRVTPGTPNTVRTQPGIGGNSLVVGQIPGGGEFSVLAGPVCDSSGRYYWEVQYGSLLGWTAEGQGTTYWLEPK